MVLNLKTGEFKDLGDVFASVTNQLKAVIPDSAKRAQLMDLSRRVTALGRLTAGVAHEVKNPLNAMMIHLELLRTKLRAAARQAVPEPQAVGHGPTTTAPRTARGNGSAAASASVPAAPARMLPARTSRVHAGWRRSSHPPSGRVTTPSRRVRAAITPATGPIVNHGIARSASAPAGRYSWWTSGCRAISSPA